MLTAKWPLVLTANQAPLWLRESQACHIRPVEPCPTAELALLLGMIWAAEGLPTLPLTAFTDLARSFAGDVRSAIMNLQVWASRLSALLQQHQHQQQRAPPQLLAFSLQSPSSPSSSSPSLSLSLSPPAANPAAALNSNAKEDDEGEEAVLEGSHRVPSAGAAAAADNAPLIFGYRCPVVKSVRPFSGRLVGGTRITIKGHNFLQPSDEAAGTWAPVDVLLGHMPCSDVTVLSDDMIKATTPPCPRSLSSAANGQFPIVVRVTKFASNEAVRQLACHSSFLYQNKQRCIDELFPELRVPKHRLKRHAGALCDQQQQQEEEEEEGEGDEWDEERVQQGREGKESEGDSPTECRNGIASEEGNRQAKRRKVVLESDDDKDEDKEKEGSEEGKEAKAQRDILVLRLNGSDREEGEEGGGVLMTTPMATGSMVLPDGTDSTQMVVGTTDGTLPAPEDEEEEEKEKVAAGATAAATVAVEDEDEENDAMSEAPERVWREVLKPPSFKGQRQVDTAVLATLDEHTEALSYCDFLRAFPPGLDGDDFLQAPCSSLLRRGVTAQVRFWEGGRLRGG